MISIFFKKKVKYKNGIYSYNLSNNGTKEIINLYNKQFFQNYSEKDERDSIQTKGQKNFISKTIKEKMGFNSNFLEVGCGTSQLSNYLGIGSNNNIFAFDLNTKSLDYGYQFAKNNGIKNVYFINANLFDDIFNNEVFDIIFCSDVLHYTNNPYEGFKIISKYLKKNGYIIIGLYNRFGRCRTNVRRLIYKFISKKLAIFFDPYIRKNKKNKKKINRWIQDQYENQILSNHTYDEVLKWFELNNIEFINFYPSNLLSLQKKDLFTKNEKGNYFERICEQILMIFNKHGDEGGLFITVGKKK
jgi:ubiquinone/menaquinone biosynthesis C-methylase UbiE